MLSTYTVIAENEYPQVKYYSCISATSNGGDLYRSILNSHHLLTIQPHMASAYSKHIHSFWLLLLADAATKVSSNLSRLTSRMRPGTMLPDPENDVHPLPAPCVISGNPTNRSELTPRRCWLIICRYPTNLGGRRLVANPPKLAKVSLIKVRTTLSTPPKMISQHCKFSWGESIPVNTPCSPSMQNFLSFGLCGLPH
jgi:hypothetical protein